MVTQPKVSGKAGISSGTYINCLEMNAKFLALRYSLPHLTGYLMLVQTENMVVVSYINHQEGLCSHPMFRLVQQILFWVQDILISLKVVYIPGHLNFGSRHPVEEGVEDQGM